MPNDNDDKPLSLGNPNASLGDDAGDAWLVLQGRYARARVAFAAAFAEEAFDEALRALPKEEKVNLRARLIKLFQGTFKTTEMSDAIQATVKLRGLEMAKGILDRKMPELEAGIEEWLWRNFPVVVENAAKEMLAAAIVDVAHLYLVRAHKAAEGTSAKPELEAALRMSKLGSFEVSVEEK